MTTIKKPSDKFPTDEVVGPNFPSSTDPDFNEPWRNPAGDVALPGRYVGQGKTEPDNIVVSIPTRRRR